MSKSITIKINNWGKYNNSRARDVKRPWWFACSNNLHRDQDFLEFNEAQRLCWVYILCEASIQQSDKIAINVPFHAQMWRVSETDLIECIRLLKQKHIVGSNSSTGCRNHTTEQDRTVQNRTERIPSTKVPGPSPGALLFYAYRNKFMHRYKIEPVRNAKVNNQFSQLAKRIGAEDGVKLINWFMDLNDDWIIKRFHSIDVLLKDCEQWRARMLAIKQETQWQKTVRLEKEKQNGNA